MPSSNERFRHSDGIVCTWSSMNQAWYHWDHEQPEPGPRERRSYVCHRAHIISTEGSEVPVTMKSNPGDQFVHSGRSDKNSPCTFDGEDWTYNNGRVNLVCQHYHPGDSMSYKPVGPDTESDRGDFGMPTLGVRAGEMMGAWANGPGQVFVMPKDPDVNGKVERVSNIMDEAQTLYKRKAAGYAGVEGDLSEHLGVKAQFVDINRKFWRIKAMLWDEVVPMYPDAGAGEDIEEILMDFIGHAALTIDFLRRAKEEGQ